MWSSITISNPRINVHAVFGSTRKQIAILFFPNLYSVTKKKMGRFDPNSENTVLADAVSLSGCLFLSTSKYF